MFSLSPNPLHLLPKPRANREPESIGSNLTLTPKRKPQRRTFSCLPCRKHKVKCNRLVPCNNCIKYCREDTCRKHPALKSGAASANRGPPELRVAQRPLPPSQESGARISNPTVPQTSSASTCHGSGLTPAVCSQNVGGTHRMSVRDCKSLQAHSTRNRTYSACEEDAVEVQSPAGAAHILALTPPLDWACNIPCMSHMTSVYNSRRWRYLLVQTVPTQSQCDVIVSFFLENSNWIYQVIHAPSFRQAYAAFWTDKIDEISLLWLSLLFAVLSVSAIYLPREVAELVGLDSAQMGQLSKSWYVASRQCLLAGGAEARPNLLQLQTFLTLQSYWFTMEDVETLNSCLGQAVRAAQSLGLDIDTSTAISAESEMRHRIWWEICTADTFQSICLNRMPLIPSRLSKVPLPSNCNDVDMGSERLAPRPFFEPTEGSFNLLRSEATRILNRLFSEYGQMQPSYELACAIDTDLETLTSRFPWYRQLCSSGSTEQTAFLDSLPPALAAFPWECHLFHAFLCVQRMRLYRPFLETGDLSAKKAVLNASTDAFAVYRTIRAQHADNLAPIRHRFSMHTYQLFSTAISLVLFLVKEMPPDPAASKIRADVEMVAIDLEYSQERRLSLPLAVHGSRILRHVLSLYDARGPEDELVQISLISSVYSVIGGKDRTLQYLERPRTTAPSMDYKDDNYDTNDFTFPTTLEAWDPDASLCTFDEGLHGFLDLSFWEQFQ